jgi:hypothetical protein
MDAWPHVPESVASSDGATRRVERRRTGSLPILLTVDETADLLRTTRRAIYAMIERRQQSSTISTSTNGSSTPRGQSTSVRCSWCCSAATPDCAAAR